MIYLTSLLLPLLILLPNLFFAASGGARPAASGEGATQDAAWPASGRGPSGRAASLIGAGGASGAEPMPYVLLERVGQVGLFLGPVLYPIQLSTLFDTIAVVVMAISLGIYYACWTRYFSRGKSRKLLLKSLLGIPIPMAIMPIIYFLAAAELQRSYILVIAAVLFAGGHLPITLMQRKALSKDSAG